MMGLQVIVNIRSSTPASGCRAFPWPVLEAGNGSFVRGLYGVDLEHKEPGRSFELTHRIEGAELIERWIRAGFVRFVCSVSAPVSAYRQLHVSENSKHLVKWNPDDLGSYPLFTPMIVCGQDIDHRIDADSDGVNVLWDGMELRLMKGARLAVCSTFALQSGVRGLLDFCQREDLEAGQFQIEPSSEGGFRFKVQLAVDLFRYLNREHSRQEPGGRNIMTHIVSAALSRLQRDFGDDDGGEGWESYANLLALANELEKQGLPNWSDDTFQPEIAATRLYPCRIPEAD